MKHTHYTKDTALRTALSKYETMKKLLMTLGTIFCYSISTLGQITPIPDCINAIDVCQNVYQVNAPQGVGNVLNEINNNSSCLLGENNSSWFKINVLQDGTLSFILTPNSAVEDFNWAVFNLTGTNCSAIPLSANLMVACNNSSDLIGSTAARANGQTGAYTNSPWFGGLSFSPYAAFEADIAVTAGETYALYINNLTSVGGQGYTIDFSNSTATFFNNAPPMVDTVAVNQCGGQRVDILFSQPVLCTSVEPTDFTMTTPFGTFPATAVNGANCIVGAGGNTTATLYTISFGQVLGAGNYTLNLTGAVEDACNQVLTGVNTPFNIPNPTADAGVDMTFCNGAAIQTTLGTSTRQQLAYQWTAIPSNWVDSLDDATVPQPTLIATNPPVETVTFILTVSAGANCVNTDTVIVDIIDCCSNFNVSISDFQNVSCFNASTGRATALATGSMSSNTVNYSWNTTPQRITASVTGLRANTLYVVTATDDNLCEDTAQITLTQPTVLTTTTVGRNTSCFGGTDGSIDLTVSGGTPPYTYSWDNAPNVEDPTGLAAGVYNVTVMDVNNCTLTDNASISQPSTPLVVNASAATIPCGTATGDIVLTVSGGGTPYTFNWSSGLGNVQSPTGVLPGIYTCTVTDVFRCTKIVEVTVQNSAGLMASATTTTANCDILGSIDLNVTGGQAPYTYAWDQGLASTQDQPNVAEGTYHVTVTDANACITTLPVTVFGNNVLTIDETITPVRCHGDAGGSISVSVVGNNTPFSFNWAQGLGTSPNLTGLTAGTYTVTITDNGNNCTIVKNYTITQPNEIQTSFTTTDPTCNMTLNGSINTNIAGGTRPYNFDWNTGPDVEDPTGLSEGFYSLTVTDANQCTHANSVILFAPPAISATATPTHVSCIGGTDGSINLSVIGGTSPYNFDWDNAPDVQNPTGLTIGDYTVTITDAAQCIHVVSTTLDTSNVLQLSGLATSPSCNGFGDGSIVLNVSGGSPSYNFQWDNGLGTVQNPTNLTSGTYQVTVTDANQCMLTSTFSLSNPSILSVTGIGTDASCSTTPDGSITLSATGGRPNYTFQWDNGVGMVQNPSNLLPNTYTVTVTDRNQCTATTSVTIGSPPQLSVSTTETPPDCTPNGTITATSTGGTPNYTYTWSANANTGNSPTATNLGAGIYRVTVTDANGCTVVSNNITFGNVGNLQVETDIIQPHCTNNSGIIGLTILTGAPPINYVWTANANTGNSNIATGLDGGLYGVTVTDAGGCDTVLSYNLINPSLLSVDLAITDAFCGQDTGAINYTIISGTDPIVFDWAGSSASGPSRTGLFAGLYAVTISDDNDCEIIDTITVDGSPVLEVVETVNMPTCSELGSVNLAIQSGTPNYDYNWSLNAMTGNSPSATDLESGNYTATVTDAAGCVAIIPISIADVINPLSIELVDLTDVSCLGERTGSITVNAIGTDNPVNYNWSNGATANQLLNLSAGDYTVTITDAVTTCSVTQTYTIHEPNAADVDVDTAITITAGATATLEVRNPQPDFFYSWTGSDGFAGTGSIVSVAPSETTTYVLEVTVGDCDPIQMTITVFVNELEGLEIPEAFSPNFDGKNDIFRIIAVEQFQIVEFKIFNRWGQVIYDDLQGEWDGTHDGQPAPNGSYVYMIEVIRKNGVEQIYKGDVILVK